MLYFILYALSEMTLANLDSESFMTFATQAFDSGTGVVNLIILEVIDRDKQKKQ